MTDITILKNVEEEFDLSVPTEFEVNDGHAAKFSVITTLSVGSVYFSINPTAEIGISQTFSADTPNTGKGDGGNTLDITANNTDCEGKHYGTNGRFWNHFDYLEMGNLASIVPDATTKLWIPFTTALSQGQAIVSARLYLTAYEADSGDCKVKLGCDNNIPAVAPTNYSSINILSMYGEYTNVVFEDWALNTQYSYDVTDAVQEILDDANWVSGYDLAILIFDNGSDVNADRTCWSGDYTDSAKRPHLIITY